ncbi:hypothetical protein BC830DRAFT_151232 [Chytriomyces sp. MP71]|nr:hypothetical protein BC830DRAFT_151232 [Chytriomyces sp. MP71]
MNRTANATDTDPWTPYFDKAAIATDYDTYITGVCSVLELLSLACLIFLDKISPQERRERANENKSYRKKIWTTINLILVFLIVVNLASIALYDVHSTDPVVTLATNATSQTLFYIFAFSVALYTYYRSHPIIVSIQPRAVVYLRATLWLVGLLSITEIPLSVLSNMDATVDSVWNAALADVTLVSEIINFLFDASILLLLAKYLTMISGIVVGMDMGRLSIISRYGIASFVTYQVFLASSVALYLVSEADIPAIPVWVFAALTHVQNLAPSVYIVIQIAMKRSLQLERQRENESAGEILRTDRDRTPVKTLSSSNRIITSEN